MKQTRTKSIVIDQEGNEVRPERAASFDPRLDARADQAFDFQTFGFGGRPLTRAERVARLDAIANVLDMAFILPGTNVRYGVDGLIGLIPVVGDIITTAIALWIVGEARALGAPRHVIARMLANVALDSAVGAVPLLGDAFDVAFKANVRNVRLLRKWIDRQR